MFDKRLAVRVLWAGRLDYGSALCLQRSIANKHKEDREKRRMINEGAGGDDDDDDNNNSSANSLILVEHEPVYTVGIRDKSYDKDSEMKLRRLGAEFHKTNRGGLITYHGPGQLVAYPIINLKLFETGIRRYVFQMEQTIIRVCAEFGIKADRTSDTGVWVDDRKICAIGIHASRYITTHGLALNCNTDLKWYDHIVPCGIVGKGVTSISQELHTRVDIEDVVPLFKNAFKDQFQCDLVQFPIEEASKLIRSSSSSGSVASEL